MSRVTLTHDPKQAFARRPINPAITIVANSLRWALVYEAVNADLVGEKPKVQTTFHPDQTKSAIDERGSIAFGTSSRAQEPRK